MKSERGDIESDKLIKDGKKLKLMKLFKKNERSSNSLKSQIQICKYSDTKKCKNITKIKKYNK